MKCFNCERETSEGYRYDTKILCPYCMAWTTYIRKNPPRLLRFKKVKRYVKDTE